MVNLSVKTWSHKPKNRRYELYDGTVVLVKFKIDKIDAKVRALDSYVRAKDGSIMTVPVPVQATFVEVVLLDGTTFSARSCCKPPDVFNEDFGIHTAVKRLFKKITLHDKSSQTISLTKSAKTELFQKLCWFLAPV